MKRIKINKPLKSTITSLFCLLITALAFAQSENPKQNIRGTILDVDTKIPLIGASVILLGSSPIKGATTDIDGNFKIENIDIGRVDLEVTYLGYEPALLRSLQLSSGKEMVLNIEMAESTVALEEVVVVAKHNKSETLNEMATVSARSFSVEETSRYASSAYDPARMAKNYAGVSASGGDDLLNEIVVRGNSPRGVLWRLEGIEIPNPNHFGSMGNSGGGISMLSSSTLSNSDFYTGAFPSEFGNATSGVFDLNMRKGNNEKREYALMVGILGIEAAAEGPFRKGGKASYLINYRYSTLSALGALGIDLVGDIFPAYQDLSFKFNFPTKKAGVLSLFGLGGSNTASYSPKADSTTWNNDFGNFGFSEDQMIGTVGMSHRILLSEKSYLRTVAIASFDNAKEQYYELNPAKNYAEEIEEKGQFLNTTYRISSTYNHKFNAKHTLRAGAILSNLEFDLTSEYFNEDENKFFTLFANKGTTQLYQVFSAWKYRVNDELTFNTGIHYTRFALNNRQALEPRFAAKWQFAPQQSLSGAVGLHSKPEHISFYFVENKTSENERTSPNKNLKFLKSMHAVLGYDLQFNANLRLKAEAYYQKLYDVPVEDSPNSVNSIINAKDIWDIAGNTNGAVNEGTGYNYGLDLTLEKFFSDQYYFLFTGSVFDSKYTPKDGNTYNTRFNTNYQVNLLGGKEFKIGKKKKNVLGVNGKFVIAGGNRYTPIDLEASKAAGYTIRIPTQAFEDQAAAYGRFDLGVSYKINTNRMTHTISLDIQNITNRANVFSTYFDSDKGQIETFNQVGLFPIFNYRLEF